MEVGNDGVAVITISNPPVNSLASPSKEKSFISSTSPSLDHGELISFFKADLILVGGIVQLFLG